MRPPPRPVKPILFNSIYVQVDTGCQSSTLSRGFRTVVTGNWRAVRDPDHPVFRVVGNQLAPLRQGLIICYQ